MNKNVHKRYSRDFTPNNKSPIWFLSTEVQKWAIILYWNYGEFDS